MKDCNCIQGIESLFNEKEAENRLKSYRKDGPAKTTRILIEALKRLAQSLEGKTLLDIGGGVGAIGHELLRAGAERVIGVDASTAYLKAAQEEAVRQGHADRVSYHHANYVDFAPQVPPADIVTLDRVICCYHDVQALVGQSVAKASALYGLVYPRDTWWMRAAVNVANLYFRIVRNPFRVYVHHTQDVNRLVRDNGLQQRFYKTSGPWQVVVYART
jgi:predicted TPR repeat methyltransferase